MQHYICKQEPCFTRTATAQTLKHELRELDRVHEPGNTLVDAATLPCSVVATSEDEGVDAQEDEGKELASRRSPDTGQVSVDKRRYRREEKGEEGAEKYQNQNSKMSGGRTYVGKSTWRKTSVAKIPPIPPKAITVAVETER